MITLENLKKLKVDDALKAMRDKAWDRASVLGLPQRSEAFQYVPMGQFYAASFPEASPVSLTKEILHPHIYPECRESVIVFIDGKWSEEHSHLPKQAVLLSLPQAMKSYGAFLQARWKLLENENDPFAALNAALHPQGAFLFIPPKAQLSHPIQILNVITGPYAFPRLHVCLGTQAKANCILTHISLTEEAYLFNGVVDILLDQGAELSTTCLALSSAGAWHFNALRATLKRDSTLHSIHVTTGSKSVRQDYRISLTGENANADLRGICMLDGSRQAHSHVVMEHEAPHCRSMQLFKGVLNGTSKSSFEGKIKVEPEAQKTQAYQLNKHLLLDDRAMASSKPNLEIFADDVKASHGATVSQPDPLHLLYLQTRGIPKSHAKTLLVRGFCKEIIDCIPSKSVRQHIAHEVQCC